jgi:hypothetical protein
MRRPGHPFAHPRALATAAGAGLAMAILVFAGSTSDTMKVTGKITYADAS